MWTGVLPFSRRLRSSLLWRTICGPWCHWLRSSGCRNVLLDPPEADFSTDPSSRSWSGRGIVPRRKETFYLFIFLFYFFFKPAKVGKGPHAEVSSYLCSPSQTQSSHRFGWVDLQRMEGSQLPFHRWGLQGPTSPQLCYNPKKIQHCFNWENLKTNHLP